MNKILLIYPSFLSGKETNVKPLYTDLPLSVITLAAQLVENHFEVEIIDECLEGIMDNELYRKLEGCFMVGISAITSYQIINGLKFADKIKSYNKDIKIVWGGWHASLMPDETIRHPNIDIVIKGQGEIQIVQVAESIKCGKTMEGIPNLTYKSANERIVTTENRIYEDHQLRNNIITGYQCIEVEKYIHSQWGNKRVLGYESSRGCCFTCRFCSIGSIFKGKWYGLPAEDVYRDIGYLKHHYNIDAVHFFDNNFFVNKNRVMNLSDLFIRDELGVRWDGTIVVPQFLTYKSDEIEYLKKSGMFRIIAGIESGDSNVLSKIHKHHTNEQVLECARRCKEYEIMLSLSFIVGFPWNPEEDTKNTLELIQQVKEIYHKTEILLFIFSPYLGTPLYEASKEYGMVFPDSLEGWAQFTYDKANTPWMSEKLCRKINRYLSFFGTKELTGKEEAFFAGFHKG